MASQLIVSSLQTLTDAFHKDVNAARKDLQAYTDINEFLKYEKAEFTKKNFTRLTKCAVYGQGEIMKKLQVNTRAEMEKLWAEHLDNPDVKEAVDALMDAEKKWLAFVEEVDQMLALEEDKLTTNSPASVGQQLQKDLYFVNGSSGCPEKLEMVLQESTYSGGGTGWAAATHNREFPGPG